MGIGFEFWFGLWAALMSVFFTTACTALILYLMVLEDRKRREEMATILETIEDLKAKQISQNAKLTGLVTAMGKIQTDVTVLNNKIEALKAEGDPAAIKAKLEELATLAQINLDTATTALEEANAIDARTPETPDPSPGQ